MGVSGCGKSAIAQLLSNASELPFFDADDFHPKENIKKMSSGLLLNGSDRKEWLISMNTLAKKQQTTTEAIIAYSALKEKAQRDFFGAHIFKRINDPENKDHHANWTN